MVSAQRAVDGESTAGKYTVEWTSEGEQKSLYVSRFYGTGFPVEGFLLRSLIRFLIILIRSFLLRILIIIKSP